MTHKGKTLSSGDEASREAHHAHHQADFEDLSELLDRAWDEEKVLENFGLRFLSGKPYTGSGSVMVAVNPCRDLVDLYDRDMQVRQCARGTY